MKIRIDDFVKYDLLPGCNSLKDTAVLYTGRVWKWLTTDIPLFFNETLPAYISSFFSKKAVKPPKKETDKVDETVIKPKPQTPLKDPRLRPTIVTLEDMKQPKKLPPPLTPPKDDKEDHKIIFLPPLSPPAAKKIEPPKKDDVKGKEKEPKKIDVKAPEPKKVPIIAPPPVPRRENNVIILPSDPVQIDKTLRWGNVAKVKNETPAPIGSKIKNSIPWATFTQINVLHQLLQQEGFEKINIGVEACGYHAFKNAMAAIALAFDNRVTHEAFLSETIYLYFFEFLKAFRPSDVPGRRDIPLPYYTKIFQSFADKKTGQLPILIQPLHEVFVNHQDSISCFNLKMKKTGPGREITFDDISEDLLLTDISIFPYLLNLKQISQSKGPLIHAFLMGIADHWVTMIYEVDNKGQAKWYGCDSLPFESSGEYLRINQNALFIALSKVDRLIEQAYEEVAGADFNRKVKHLNEDGTVKNNSDSQKAIEGITPGLEVGKIKGEDYLEKLRICFNYVQKAGWLESDDSKIRRYLKDMLILTRFFYDFDRKKLEFIKTFLEAALG